MRIHIHVTNELSKQVSSILELRPVFMYGHILVANDERAVGVADILGYCHIYPQGRKQPKTGRCGGC